MQIKIAKYVCFLITTIFLLIFIVFNSCKKIHDTNPYPRSLPSIPVDSINSKISVTSKLLDSSGKPLANVFYTIKSPSAQDTLLYQSGFTDSSGNIAAQNLHARTLYTLNVYQYNFCGAALYSKNFTTPNTLQTQVDLGNFVIEPVSTIISGIVVDCNYNPFKSGTVTVDVDIKNSNPNNSNLIIQPQYQSSINTDGTFQLRLSVCSKTDSVPVTIYVEDATGLQVGNQVYYSIHYPENNIEKIQGCNSIDTVQYLNINVDSTHYSFYPAQYIETAGDLTSTFIVASPTFAADFRLLGFLAVGKPGLIVDQLEFPQYVTGGPVGIVNINEYGPVGGFIARKIQGQVFGVNDRSNHDATVSFRVKRKQ